MNKRTRSGSRKQRVYPYSIPTETLGHVYRHVEDPFAFGRVNTAFRSVHTDPHFEKQRKQQMVENDIRRNGGSRVFINAGPTSSKALADEFFNGYGCVEIHLVEEQPDSEYPSNGIIYVATGSSIKRVLYKGILGVQTIMGNPPLKHVGRFNILEALPEQTSNATRVHFSTDFLNILETTRETFDNNVPQLRTDLLQTIRNDLQNGCASRIFWAINKTNRTSSLKIKRISDYLAALQKAEDQNYSVRQILRAFFQRIWIDSKEPRLKRENVRIVDDTLEITLNIKLRYNILSDDFTDSDGDG